MAKRHAKQGPAGTQFAEHPLLHRFLDRIPILAGRARDVRVPFGDEATFVGAWSVEGRFFFLAGYALERMHGGESRSYRGLASVENAGLHTARHYKILEAWPQPIIGVIGGVGGMTTTGPADASAAVPVRMAQIGSAEAWWGDEAGVIWEVLLNEDVRAGLGTSFDLVYKSLWQTLGRELEAQGCRAIATEGRDPAFDEAWYVAHLEGLGYALEADGGYRLQLEQAGL